VTAVGALAFRGIDGDAQEFGQDRGRQAAGEVHERNVPDGAEVDASSCERSPWRKSTKSMAS
jgi:hypothetical protein